MNTTAARGTVSKYLPGKRYGFLIGEDKQRYFFHHNDIPSPWDIRVGDKVEYLGYEGENGLRAENVSLIHESGSTQGREMRTESHDQKLIAESTVVYNCVRELLKQDGQAKADAEERFAVRKSMFLLALAIACGATIKYFELPQWGAFVAGAVGSFSLLYGLLSYLCKAGANLGDRQLTESEYYSIRHSRDASGKHRCIFCRGVGVHRKGIYATTAYEASCTSCRKVLFVG